MLASDTAVDDASARGDPSLQAARDEVGFTPNLLDAILVLSVSVGVK